MHPVLENIRKRRNKNIPLKDGRKIALVLYGGTMTGVRGAGAVTALAELGYAHAFDEIYTYSAGFPNACSLFMKNADENSSIYFNDLIGRNFINPFRIRNIVDTDYVVKKILQSKLLDLKKLYEIKTKLYVALWNIKKREPHYLELRDRPKRYFPSLLSTSISFPIHWLHRATHKIGGGYFGDYPYNFDWVRAHLDYALNSKATDILAIYNNERQFRVPALFSHRLFEICPDRKRKMSHFERNPDVLRSEYEYMRELVTKFLG